MTAYETLFWSLDIIFYFTFCVTILLLRVGMWVESAVRVGGGRGGRLIPPLLGRKGYENQTSRSSRLP